MSKPDPTKSDFTAMGMAACLHIQGIPSNPNALGACSERWLVYSREVAKPDKGSPYLTMHQIQMIYFLFLKPMTLQSQFSLATLVS